MAASLLATMLSRRHMTVFVATIGGGECVLMYVVIVVAVDLV